MTIERQSNFELLRILSMLAIISGHFLGQGLMPLDIILISKTNYFLFLLFGSASRIAVNCFIFIGMYFLVDVKKFSSKSGIHRIVPYGTIRCI